MMLSLPSNVDLRGPMEKRAHVNNLRKRLGAFAYMKINRTVQFIVNGGLL